MINKLIILHPLLTNEYLNSEMEDFLGIFDIKSNDEVCVKWKGLLIDLCYFYYYLYEQKKYIGLDGKTNDVINNCFKWKNGINEDSFKNTLSDLKEQLIEEYESPQRQPLKKLFMKAGL